MAKKIKKDSKCECKCRRHPMGGCGVYGLGVIGAAIYYISIANGFWMGALGFLKALVWPVFLVLELLKFVGA